ncbi:type VI secretion system protein TssH, partial [Burkholderia pseudomallei]|nr:type VI secretion system protein TssH [Burkholderia pseudomallei]
LAVLARAGAPQAALALPGGIVLETGADGLRIDAPHIALAARERIDARAPRVDVSAHRAHVRAAHLDACARSIDGRAHDVRLVARRFTSTIGRALHTLGDCLRRVCGVDELHAARARWRVDERAHLHARDVTLLADRHVGIDGERIDLG